MRNLIMCALKLIFFTHELLNLYILEQGHEVPDLEDAWLTYSPFICSMLYMFMYMFH